ncbi:MAG TPA: transcriptional repressor LexA [Acidobacteria bacterium]|nr:transcriptional repressor LexA [Acidobacteriota bacterium]
MRREGQPLTERQHQVLDLVRRSVAERGVAPTLQEIADHFGFSSTASAQKHVNELVRKGWLVRLKHRRRGLVPVEAPLGGEGAAEVPLLGLVAAGQPIESLDTPAPVSVPRAILRDGEHYVLRVRGDSMVEDGILDGDLVVVQARREAQEGEMVVALVDGEVTLKRLFRQPGGRVRLQPANVSMDPIVVEARQVTVQGIVVGLMRRYD